MTGVSCEQSIDPGETIWMLHDLESQVIPGTFTVGFVIEGPDGLGRERALAALAVPPATDTVTPTIETRLPEWPALLFVWLVSVFVAVRGPGRARSSRVS